MSKDYMSTNLLLQTLSSNLNSYKPGPKHIDTYTISQLEKLLTKIEEFLAESSIVSFDGDARDRDMLLLCFHQQPNIVHCRFCNASFHEYKEALKHVGIHDRTKRQVAEHEQPGTNAPSFLEKKCIPRTAENLSKKAKKFLCKDPNSVAQKISHESKFVQIDSDNHKVLNELESCLQTCYPSVKCYQFGSRVAGTGSFSSDLDVFVDLQNVYFGRNNNKDAEEISVSIEKVTKALKKSSDWVLDVIIANARVPLLRATCPKYDMKCDLTFSNGLAHRNSELLQYMFNLQPTSRLLVGYLKEWNRESTLNAYTLSLMVIFFYQCLNRLPAVVSLQADSKFDVIIDDWNAGFATPTLEELNIKLCDIPITVLLKEFFDFYSLHKSFSMETQLVCPFLGRAGISKRIFEDYKQIPAEMVRLRQHMFRHQDDTSPRNLFAYNKPFVVQDPFELSHNVAKSIPLDVASRLLRYFNLSANFK